MASSMGRYIISSPATSFEVRELLRAAEDDGNSTVPLTASDATTHETLEIEFMPTQMRPRGMSTEYIGMLADGGIASIMVMTHPDLSDTPAQLTLVRRITP